VKLKELIEKNITKESDFQHLDDLEFNGVYILFDSEKDDEIVYIGSAYGQTIKKRLNQYISSRNSGGDSLRNKVKDIYGGNPIEIINKLKIKAIFHEDLEYKLIGIASPKFNKRGIILIKDEEEITP
jgi:excinuclease UvrABC nuclease subunit